MWTIYLKELLELVRDRRTFFFTVFVPVFAMPLIFVQRDELRPVSLGTMFFFGRFTADRGMIAAGVTLSMIPVVLLYLILQRRFIEGITAGALKS